MNPPKRKVLLLAAGGVLAAAALWTFARPAKQQEGWRLVHGAVTEEREKAFVADVRAMQACVADSDCVRVPSQCDCIAVHKRFEERYYERLTKFNSEMPAYACIPEG